MIGIGYHFGKCLDISKEVREEQKALKKTHSGRSIGQYWIESCHRKGLVDGQQGLGAESTELILRLQASADTSGHSRTSTCISSAATTANDQVGEGMANEKKLPSMVNLALFDDPSDIDHLLGIHNGDSGSASAIVAAGSKSSNGAFNFDFTGEASEGVEGVGPPPVPLAEEGAAIGENTRMEPLQFDETQKNGASDSHENSKSVPISSSNKSSSMARGRASTLNERILQKVQDALKLVEAASEMNADTSCEESQRRQLNILGKHLYRHFSGCHTDLGYPGPSVSSEVEMDSDHRHKRGKTIDAQKLTQLSEFGFPSAVSNLVKHLCRSNESDGVVSFCREDIQYCTMKDVLDELQLMIQDPDRYLFGGDLHQRGTLNLIEGKLYGRERELSELDEAFISLTLDQSRSLLCITGESGTGKSALAMTIQVPIESVGGFFLYEKFDELQQVKQIPVVFSALDALCSEIVRRGGSFFESVKNSLKISLGSEINILMSTIPSLGAVIGRTEGEAPDLTGHRAFMRLLSCVRQLVKCISCKDHPIVLIIDDLQWADEFSLALIEAILSDVDISSFLLIGCYRSGEVPQDHPLLKKLNLIEASGTPIRNEIQVDNIERSSVTTMIADALQIMPSKARPLANLIHSKTSGQPLFVIQFIKSLYEDGFLRYSLSSHEWDWDTEKISAMGVADTVAEIMTSKMLRYNEEVLISLKLAACLGHEFDTKTLDLLGADAAESSGSMNGDEGPTMTGTLHVALLDGLLIRTQTPTSTTYKFSHDQIQLAVYSLIRLDEQPALHLQIARLLLSKTPADELDSILFIIVDQFCRGLSLITDRTEKTQVAQLYLKAATKALSLFAHTAAAMFSEQGIALIDEDHWRSDYPLSLGLYSASAEANNIGGYPKQVETSANVIFSRAQTFEDKLPAYLSLVQATGREGNLMKATSLGLEVLRKLGVILPTNPDENTALMAIDQTRAMLESIPMDIVFGRLMHDKKALFAMKMLSLISIYTSMAFRPLLAIIYCRMVQLTVEHGVCNISVIAIGCYAYALANSGNLGLGDKYNSEHLVLGNKYKNLALSLIDQFQAKDAIPQVYGNVFAVMIQVDPIQATFSQLEVAIRIAQEYGDNDVACGIMNRGIAGRFTFGVSLQSVVTLSREYIQKMEKIHETNYCTSTKIFLQAALNLLDPSCREPSTLTGEYADQASLLAIATEKNYKALIMQIFRLRIYIAYLYRQYDLAAELVDTVLTTLTPRAFAVFLAVGTVVTSTFHFGLVAGHMARTKDAEKWLPVMSGCLRKMKIWSEASPWNYGHMMRLLEAEDAYAKGEHEEAQKAYEEAFRLAREHKFIHDEALCLERAALYYADTRGDASDLSVTYMAEAKELYIKWGALGKAMTM